MTIKPTVFIVDDDEDFSKILSIVLEKENFSTRYFRSGDEFLQEYRSDMPGCLILDYSMPKTNGLDVLTELHAHHMRIPVIMLTSYNEVPLAVKAMQLGAIEFQPKPVKNETLLKLVRSALQRDHDFRESFGDPADAVKRLATLSPRESQTLDLLVGGETNVSIANTLDISNRTVESHRKNIMKKMGVLNFADLVRVALFIGCKP